MRCPKAFVGAQGIAPLSPALEMSNVLYPDPRDVTCNVSTEFILRSRQIDISCTVGNYAIALSPTLFKPA
jgi:hypothetical protein